MCICEHEYTLNALKPCYYNIYILFFLSVQNYYYPNFTDAYCIEKRRRRVELPRALQPRRKQKIPGISLKRPLHKHFRNPCPCKKLPDVPDIRRGLLMQICLVYR